MRNYKSLTDPRGVLSNLKLRFPAEPLLGSRFTDDERQVLLSAFDESCNWRVGFRASEEVSQLEAKAAEEFGFTDAIAFNGAGAAMDLVLRALNVDGLDEVICSASSFHGQHLSVLGTQARLRLADIDEKSCCISASSVESLLSARTQAVIATDIHGALCDYAGLYEVLQASSKKAGVQMPRIIADSARSTPFAEHKACKFIDILVLSMQSKKLWTTLGEGGLVLTNDTALASTLRQYRSFGENRGWGSNYKLSKLQAAVGLVQLKRLRGMVSERREHALRRYAYLRNELSSVELINGDDESHCFSYFALELPAKFGRRGRDMLIETLARDFAIGAVVANPPTYLYNRWICQRTTDRTPTAETYTDRIICLPLHVSFNAEAELYIRVSFLEAFTDVSHRLQRG